MSDQELIEAVTTAAEAGKGTTLRELLKDMSYEEQYDVLKAATTLNEEHNKTNPLLPDLTLKTEKNGIWLVQDPEGWFRLENKPAIIYSIAFSELTAKPNYLYTLDRKHSE